MGDPTPLAALVEETVRSLPDADVSPLVIWACHWLPEQGGAWFRHTWSAAYGEPGMAEFYAREYVRGLVERGHEAHVDVSRDGGRTWRKHPSAWELPVRGDGC